MKERFELKFDDKNNLTDKSFASLIGKKSGAQGNCQISACEHSDTGEQNGDDGERNTGYVHMDAKH